MPLRPPKISLEPVERILLLMIFLAVALSALYQVAPRSRWDFYIMQTLGAADNYVIGLCLVAGLMFLSAIFSKRFAGSIKQRIQTALERFVELFLAPREILRDVRMLAAALVLLAVFGQLKHLIPLVNQKLYDPALLASERFVFGGHLSGEWVQGWLSGLLGSAAAPFMSLSYTGYYFYLTTIILIFVLQRNRALAQEFLVAFSLLWLFGALVAYVAPTLGPCFVVPELYSHLPETSVSILQQNMWYQKQALDLDPHNAQALYLIAALPSLHIGVLLLGSIYLRRVSIILAAGSWVMVLLTGLATLYFGWHYLVDHLAALGLVVLVMTLAKPICGAKKVGVR